MVQKCCVTSCRSQRFGNPGLKLHKFPKQKNLNDKWVAALNKICKISPSIHTRICSRHFKVSDYITIFDLTRLKRDAIPSMFHAHKTFSHEFKETVENNSVASISTEKLNLLEDDRLLDQNLEFEEIVVNDYVASTSTEKLNLLEDYELLDQNLEFEEILKNDYVALTSTDKINFLEDDELLNQILEFEESVKNYYVAPTSTEKNNLLKDDELLDQNLETEYIPRIWGSRKNEILYQPTAVSIASIEIEHSYCKHTSSPIKSVGSELLDRTTILLEPEKLPDIYIKEALSTKKNFESMPTKNCTPLRKRKLMRFCGDHRK